jgi:hypothetical protein
MIQRYEYGCLTYGPKLGYLWTDANEEHQLGEPENEVEALNRVGHMGWELVATTVITTTETFTSWYFKRPVRPES